MREPKKVKPNHRQSRPPSRAHLVKEFRRGLWEKMVHLHGTSIDKLDENGQLSDFDKGLIREFGQYKGEKTLGHFRPKCGLVAEPIEEEAPINPFAH